MNDDDSVDDRLRTPRADPILSEGLPSDAYDPDTRPRPTRSYSDLDRAYEFFNRELFGGILRPCLITLQRTRRSRAYYSADRFANVEHPNEIADEIALNPIHFAAQQSTKTLATLAHEMVHLWQNQVGKPSRGRYHNNEWARKMVEIGLIPSSTGEPGGAATGESVSHYIKPGGRFEFVCAAYLAGNSPTLFQDRAYSIVETSDRPDGGSDDDAREHERGRASTASPFERANRERERKAASKTRFTCPRCKQNAWATRRARLLCGGGECDGEEMAP